MQIFSRREVWVARGRLLRFVLILVAPILSFYFLVYASNWSDSPYQPFFEPISGPYPYIFATKHLIWPSLILSRMGFSHTWMALPLLALFLVLLAFRWKRIILTISLGLSTYCFLAWAAVWLFPVPIPFSASNPPPRYNHEDFRRGYVRAYREGTMNVWSNPHGIYPDSYRLGLQDGLLAGSAERDRVAPGRIDVQLREFLQKEQHPTSADPSD